MRQDDPTKNKGNTNVFNYPQLGSNVQIGYVNAAEDNISPNFYLINRNVKCGQRIALYAARRASDIAAENQEIVDIESVSEDDRVILTWIDPATVARKKRALGEVNPFALEGRC
jgi:hypothetical protein